MKKFALILVMLLSGCSAPQVVTSTAKPLPPKVPAAKEKFTEGSLKRCQLFYLAGNQEQFMGEVKIYDREKQGFTVMANDTPNYVSGFLLREFVKGEEKVHYFSRSTYPFYSAGGAYSLNNPDLGYKYFSFNDGRDNYSVKCPRLW